jgi:spermidine/putrescine transport system permease protein
VKKINGRALLGIPYVLFMVIFVLLPLLLIAFYAFTDDSGFSVTPFLNFVTSAEKWNVLLMSLVFGFLNTVLCLLIGYPLAYFLANKNINKNKILVMLFVMPMWINFVLRTWATRDVLVWIGLSGGIYPELATMIGLVSNYLPFTILPLYTTMLKMDRSQIEASSDLGATPFITFIKIIIPMTLPGIISASLMVFMPTMTSYVISDILSEGKVTLFGKFIALHFENNLWHDGSMLALVMMILIAISFGLSRLFQKKKVGEVSN